MKTHYLVLIVILLSTCLVKDMVAQTFITITTSKTWSEINTEHSLGDEIGANVIITIENGGTLTFETGDNVDCKGTIFVENGGKLDLDGSAVFEMKGFFYLYDGSTLNGAEFAGFQLTGMMHVFDGGIADLKGSANFIQGFDLLNEGELLLGGFEVASTGGNFSVTLGAIFTVN